MSLARKTVGTICVLLLAAILLPLHAHAASPLGIGTAEPSFNTNGFGGPFLAWINHYQEAFYRSLTGALVSMKTDPWKLSTLIGLSFLYGIFHAAGPGHGKAVISSYMIANEIQLRRGILISFISSMLQAVTAILVVGAAYLVLRGTSISLTNATDALEMASYLLVAGFGLWLLYRKIRNLVTGSGHDHDHSSHSHSSHAHEHHDHGHHAHDHHAHGHVHAHAAHSAHAHDDHGHHHDHHHDHQGAADFCEECGHAHMPSPQSLSGETFSIREAFSAVFAVGLRPCSGAIIVLTFSLLNSLYLGGVLSVFAMAIGTAITVSALAIMAVSAKGLAVRFAGNGTTAAMRVGNAIEILGALLVTLMGIVLFLAALQAGR
jgi:nickel/cobalt transporter (NicO) family protein